MNKIWIISIGIILISLAGAASYPTQLTSNTDTTYKSGTTTPIPTEYIATIPDGPISGGVTFTSTQTTINKKLFSEEEICKLTRGCWGNNECYPYGYHYNNSYCGLDYEFKLKYHSERIRFVNQFNTSENCSDDFECKSNFCFNGECVDTIKTVDDEVVRINKSDLDELRGIIEKAEKSMEEDYNEEVSRNFLSSLMDLFRSIFKD